MKNKPYQPPAMLPPSHPVTSICHVFLALSYIYFVISPASSCLYCHMFTLSTEKPQPLVDSDLVLKASLEFWYIFDGWPAPQKERSSIKDMPCPVSLGGNVTQVLQSLSVRVRHEVRCLWVRSRYQYFPKLPGDANEQPGLRTITLAILLFQGKKKELTRYEGLLRN